MKHIIALILWISSPVAFGIPTCQNATETCTDSTPCKTINGNQVCLADIGQTCWSYQDDFTCLNPNSTNYCQPLIALEPTCQQTDSTCSQTDTIFGTGCMMYTNTFTCGPGGPSTPPVNTVQLKDSYTLISSGYDPAPCASLSSSPNCTLAQTKCTSTTPPTLPPGVTSTQVAPDGCYQETNTYVCLAGTPDNSACTALAADPNCSQIASTCMGTPINGTCPFQDVTYKCLTSPAQTSTNLNCDGQTFCLNGSCANTGYQNDPAFAKAMVMLEISREGGNNKKNTELFPGQANGCHINNYGLAKCCNAMTNTAPSDFEILALATQVSNQYNIASTVSQYTYETVINPAINYVSSLVGSTATTAAASSAAAASTQAGAAATANGLTSAGEATTYATSFTDTSSTINIFMTSTTPVSTATPLATQATCQAAATEATAQSSFGAFMSSVNSFMAAAGPWILAAEIALMVYQELSSCNSADDIKTNEARGQNLCVEVGSYCADTNPNDPLGCDTEVQNYCCFTSILARIINEQGRPQIGKGWGTAQNPSCSGFTSTELTQIDFSKIDFSEFIKVIMKDMQLPANGSQTTNITSTITKKVNNYYQNGSQ